MPFTWLIAQDEVYKVEMDDCNWPLWVFDSFKFELSARNKSNLSEKFSWLIGILDFFFLERNKILVHFVNYGYAPYCINFNETYYLSKKISSWW